MKTKIITIIVLCMCFIILGAFILRVRSYADSLQASNQPNVPVQTSPSSNEGDSDGDGIPDIAEKTLGTHPYISDTDGDGVGDLQDEDPTFLENPIKNTADQEGFQIVEALVENNEDPVTKMATDDHLELTLKNTSGKDLSDFELYYTITDLTTNQKEAYYEKLSGFVLKSGDIKTIHFDNKNESDHFTENINSMYRVNDDAKVFDITINAPNYKVVTVKINKDAGGTEKAD